MLQKLRADISKAYVVLTAAFDQLQQRVRAALPLLLILQLLLSCTQPCVAQDAPAAAAAVQKALRTVNQPTLYGPPSVLADGLKGCTNHPRNWARLSQRLSTPGATVTIAAFGGSITAGFGLPDRKQSWAYQFAGWLQEAFPDVSVNFVHNFARDGIQIQLAATCW
jgi:hypothetical protein